VIASLEQKLPTRHTLHIFVAVFRFTLSIQKDTSKSFTCPAASKMSFTVAASGVNPSEIMFCQLVVMSVLE
jgi:hypothetical protein